MRKRVKIAFKKSQRHAEVLNERRLQKCFFLQENYVPPSLLPGPDEFSLHFLSFENFTHVHSTVTSICEILLQILSLLTEARFE